MRALLAEASTKSQTVLDVEEKVASGVQQVIDNLAPVDFAGQVAEMHKLGQLTELYQLAANVGQTKSYVRDSIVLGRRS